MHFTWNGTLSTSKRPLEFTTARERSSYVGVFPKSMLVQKPVVNLIIQGKL